MNGPTRQPRGWQPEPLHLPELPVEAPHRRTRRPAAPDSGVDIDLDIDEEARPGDDRAGSHVVVIDIG
jgi:hypothetical protein